MKIKSLLAIILFCVVTKNSFSQSFTGEQNLQGYAIFGDKLTFIFDENLYDAKPSRVFVTGEFRNWDAATDKQEWELKKTGEQWLLTIDNTEFEMVKPNTQFRYRINEGEWLAPPSNSPNQRGGDLVFLMESDLVPLRAELKNENLIWAEINVDRPLMPAAYRITDSDGKEIEVAGVLPNGAATTLISPAQPLDKKRVYFLEIPDQGLKVHCSFDGWFRETFSTKELGANITNGKTTVRLFAPRATMVRLYLYKGKDDSEAFQIIEMKEDDQGVWEAFFDENLHGIYYDFTIHGADDPGNHFFGTNSVHVNDPYARVSDDTWGKARIWKKTQPASPLADGIPKMEDVIAYEVHVQDFTDNLPLPEKHVGLQWQPGSGP